jgi:hypothetical protein
LGEVVRSRAGGMPDYLWVRLSRWGETFARATRPSWRCCDGVDVPVRPRLRDLYHRRIATRKIVVDGQSSLQYSRVNSPLTISFNNSDSSSYAWGDTDETSAYKPLPIWKTLYVGTKPGVA